MIYTRNASLEPACHTVFSQSKSMRFRPQHSPHHDTMTVMSNSLETLTVEAFQPRVGERFRIRPSPDTDIPAELIEAPPLGAAGAAGTSPGRVPFSLSFRAPRTPVLPQRIYEVAHDELGSYEIFLVPIGPDDGGMVYEAIFA